MSFIKNLEERLEKTSDELEDIHLEAAIDAQLTNVTPATSNTNDEDNINTTSADTNNDVIFDDYTNPNAVLNCLSPYVPCKSKQIDAFFSQVGLSSSSNNDMNDNVLLDIGSGDGRVCISAVKMFGM